MTIQDLIFDGITHRLILFYLGNTLFYGASAVEKCIHNNFLIGVSTIKFKLRNNWLIAIKQPTYYLSPDDTLFYSRSTGGNSLLFLVHNLLIGSITITLNLNNYRLKLMCQLIYHASLGSN